MESSKFKNNNLENIQKDVKQVIKKRKLKIHIPDTKIKLKKDGDYYDSEPEIKHREIEINI